MLTMMMMLKTGMLVVYFQSRNLTTKCMDSCMQSARKQSTGFLTRFDTNRPVKEGLKLEISDFRGRGIILSEY